MSTTNGILVRVRDVAKHFQRGSEEIHVLSGLNLEVPQGEFLALMGPSGSGKSTLLNLIGGLDRPTRGAVEIGGERIDGMSDRQLASWRARHVGLVFQFYNLLPVLTAERNVELPLLLTQLSKSERRKHVATALKVVGLSNREHGKTIVMVTHDPHASARATRTVHLDKGQLFTEKPE
jgi:putative ABC transport system ATP-binding protein